MERAELRLVPTDPHPGVRRAIERWAPLSIAVGICAASLIATIAGADRVRDHLDPRVDASRAVGRLYAAGGDASVIAADLREFEERLRRRPLDASTRAAFAGLLREAATAPEDLVAARFHARRAAATAPVSLPVLALAAFELTRSGDPAGGLELCRGMFSFAPDGAADILLTLEPFADRDAVASAVPADPVARLAWARALRRAGRHDEADRIVDAAASAWPERTDVLEARAHRAFWSDDADGLLRAIPATLAIPERADAAILFAYRGMARAIAGDHLAAREDAAIAARLGADNPRVLEAAGRVQRRSGDPAAAAASWRRALFVLPPRSPVSSRLPLLEQLARLADARGDGAASLRAWRAVLDAKPDHPEAQRRIDDLTGFRR